MDNEKEFWCGEGERGRGMTDTVNAPERIWTADTTGNCSVGFNTPSLDYKNEYISRTHCDELVAAARSEGFVAGVEAAATLVETHAYTSGSNGSSLEPSEMAKHDMHHHTIATAIRAITPPEQNRSES